MNNSLTFELRRHLSPTPEHSYESFYGTITSTSVPSWHSQSTMPAKLLGSMLLGASISPGDAIAFQQQPLVQIESSQKVVAPITVPQKIESIREAFGLSTSALAEILGVSRPTIYQWTKGQQEPQSVEYRVRLDRVALLAGRWKKAFPAMNMDHWLTDNEPGEPSLMHLLKANEPDEPRINNLFSRRIADAKRTESAIVTRRRTAGDLNLPRQENNLPETVQRWSDARSHLLRTSNLQG